MWHADVEKQGILKYSLKVGYNTHLQCRMNSWTLTFHKNLPSAQIIVIKLITYTAEAQIAATPPMKSILIMACQVLSITGDIIAFYN